MNKKILFLIPILTFFLSINNVNALSNYYIYAYDQDQSLILQTNGNSITSNKDYLTYSNVQQRISYQLEMSGVLPSEQFFQLKIRICTTGINNGVSTSGYDTSGAFVNGQNYPTNSKSIGTCTVKGYTGTLYEHKYFLTFGGNIPTTGDYSQFSYVGNIITWGGASVNFNSYSQIVSANLVPITEDDLLNAQNKLQTDTIINQNQATNDKLDNIDDSITSEDPPTKLDNLSDSAGWLPAGPVDSILNLPLTMFQNLSNNIGSSCTPLVINLPYVNEDITLPCLNSIYEQIDGLSVWINSIGVIASAFILYSYLLTLYKWVDDTLTFRENNHIDNWGGI